MVFAISNTFVGFHLGQLADVLSELYKLVPSDVGLNGLHFTNIIRIQWFTTVCWTENRNESHTSFLFSSEYLISVTCLKNLIVDRDLWIILRPSSSFNFISSISITYDSITRSSGIGQPSLTASDKNGFTKRQSRASASARHETWLKNDQAVPIINLCVFSL